MYLKVLILFSVAVFAYSKTTPQQHKVVCFYNTQSIKRDGQDKYSISDLEQALPYCTHVIFGYATIAHNKKLTPVDETLFTANQDRITNLKRKYPNVKFLFSVGGGQDVEGDGDDKNIKYRELIESSALRLAFINSAYTLVKTYGFDGMDLAWEFPENKPKKIRGAIKKLWHNIKSGISGPSIIDKKAEEHRAQFTAFIRELRKSFNMDDLLVTMTVLPNVNSTVYYDPRSLAPHVDFVNVMAYDFYTTERNPYEADYTAPMYDLIDRRYDENVDFQIKYWTQNGAPANKIILGIPTYGRAWKMTSDSDINGIPPLTVDGPPTQEGHQKLVSKQPGQLSYTDICTMFQKEKNMQGGNPHLMLKKVSDTSRRKGTYAYRLADPKGNNGIWISYEDPDTVNIKVAYAKAKGLGGVALDDLSMDDYQGTCSRGDRYPLLRAVTWPVM